MVKIPKNKFNIIWVKYFSLVLPTTKWFIAIVMTIQKLYLDYYDVGSTLQFKKISHQLMSTWRQKLISVEGTRIETWCATLLMFLVLVIHTRTNYNNTAEHQSEGCDRVNHRVRFSQTNDKKIIIIIIDIISMLYNMIL